MSSNRIQKLLFSEYCDFEDMVLVESPFAQTDRNGKGIRQVQLGLTPTKLILATDVLPLAEDSSIFFAPGLDPEIETLELISIFPIQCINLSIFHHKKRRCLKAHFGNSVTLYFELGGYERNMFWNLWSEKVQFLNPEEPNSSNSETSIETSGSTSTLYLVKTKKVLTENGMQIWCRFSCDCINLDTKKNCSWDRYLFYGTKFYENPLDYKPLMEHPQSSHFLKQRRKHKNMQSDIKLTTDNDIPPAEGNLVNRFGCGIEEGCNIGLYLPSITSLRTRLPHEPAPLTDEFYQTFCSTIDYGVKIWEKSANEHWMEKKHRRRYGFTPHSNFIYGLGHWDVSSGDKSSLQIKRVVSLVSINQTPEDFIPISKKHLKTSISLNNLHHNFHMPVNIFKLMPKEPFLYFWTTNYWYKPRICQEVYRKFQSHLTNIRNYCQRVNPSNKKEKILKKLFFRSKKNKKEIEDEENLQIKNKKFSFSVNVSRNSIEMNYLKLPDRNSLEHLKIMLNTTALLIPWDFSSTTLANQITLIDRDLFIKITKEELYLVVFENSTINAPNIRALTAFSQRISCLIATSILKEYDQRKRGRLIARYINTANKCYQMSNFHSCKTILNGLQSPCIYRLQSTWAFLRKRHSTKYKLFEKLSRILRDPRLVTYQKAFAIASQQQPHLPYIGDLFLRLIGRITTSTDTNISLLCLQDKDSEENLKLNWQLQVIQDNTNLLKKWQIAASNYCLLNNNSASEYLLKATYNEENTNFFHSFQLERRLQ